MRSIKIFEIETTDLNAESTLRRETRNFFGDEQKKKEQRG